ncbi:ABC transporter ATP-binding protein [Sharpea azabuensis]|uniref:ABC transporter ATP-binding protein n=1 Tax=Sharpea azabuensis TaxID=322505 RepID=UPI00156AD43F|nr:ABC transporter ATP-binding protein [Sharpea azabuensis]
MDTIIKYEHITKSYGDHEIIHDLELNIEAGDFVTIIGSSGSGKTTVLKMVNGLIEPTSGHLYVEGKDINDVDLIDLRRHIGYAIQGSVLFPHMTVEENIAYVPRLINANDKEKTREAVNRWMNMMNLDASLKERYPSELSGGQQQRVGIARALAASPKILLMDEPFGAVDAINRTQLQDELKALHKKTGITILFVTHDIEEAIKLGTKVLVIDQGRIEQYDTPDKVLSQPATPFVEKLVKRQVRCTNVQASNCPYSTY